MARKYDVKGTSSFLIWSIALAVLCLWAIRDGWFPAESKILSHGPADNPNPGDHFYSFNRSLAWLSGIASLVCAVVHRFVK